MPDTLTEPNTAEIQSDLEYMTARWHELPDEAMFEIRAFKEGSQPQTAKFKPDWIEDAVDWIEGMNARGFNIYAVRNPIRATAAGSAKDEDILASFFLWADCDDQASTDNVRRFDGPRANAVIITGETPHTRAHPYWELEAPCTDMAEWRSMQEAIAAHFGSDRTVVNASRIMRVAGTVSYPFQRKQERGYIKEVCALTTFTDRPRVTIDQMTRVFGASKPAATPQIAKEWIEGYDDRSATDYAETLRRARTDGEKHSGVRDLAATLAGQGIKRAFAEAIIRDACPVWDANVEDLINSAYAKFYKPTDAPEVFKEPPTQDEWPTPLSDFDENNLPRRQWVYGTDYIRKFVSVTASAGGIGKTSNAVVEALAICTGRDLLGTEVKERCNVWIINLEDPVDELRMRTLAAMRHYGLKPDEVSGKLFIDGEDTIEVTLAVEGRDGVSLNTAFVDAMRDRIIEREIGVIIIDPFVSTHMVNENSNASIQAVVALLRSLSRQTEASISLVHHVRKGNGESADIDSVRGAGSLIGAARAARVINRLSDKDAEALGIAPEEARSIFRIDDGKANLAPPVTKATYRKMIGVQIANGEWVGVTVPYDLPDEWGGMSEDVVNAMLRRIDGGPDDSGQEHYSIRPQDKGRWVGTVITTWPFDDPAHTKSAAQAKQIIRQWQENGLLEEVEYHSAVQRKDRKGVISTGRIGEQR